MKNWIIAGNWKMNKTTKEACELAKELVKNVPERDFLKVLVAPPFTALKEVYNVISGSRIELCAQNCHYEERGAFTGEISPAMLVDVGCKYVILGHSERRRHFNESDELINKKVKASLSAGLNPIVCVGEDESERERGITEYVIGSQLKRALYGVGFNEGLVIAYEPVWAIGTGKNATPYEAESAHRFLRGLLGEIFGERGRKIRIIYGGSVTPENAKDLMSMENVDGLLVGGASLKSESFVAIISRALELA